MKPLYTKLMKSIGLGKVAFYRAILVFIASFSLNTASAQLALQTATLNQWLDKFVGSNVTILNPTVFCTQGEYGIFDNGLSTNLGLSGGVILSTCSVLDIGQPVNVQVATGPGSYAPGHPVLTAICGFPTHDACVVEFDFTAELDTISTLHFDYVFASEEYPEYACSSFNDPFAFIISGPGIVGNQNIAVIPGTNIPVTINSVNMAPNGTFYSLTNCNNMGPGAPFNQYYVDNQGQNGQFVVFDGFTTVMTAEAQVQPCDTYHMFLGVSNASDGGWQSGVFLKENSFTVDSTSVDLAGLIGVGGSGYIVEGCQPLSLVYSHDTSLGRPKKLCFHYGGSATFGLDYNALPDTLLIPGNVVSDSLVIVPILDGLTETQDWWNPSGLYLDSTKTDTLTIYEINCCTLDTLNPKDSIKIPIRDSLYMNLISRDTFYCEGSTDSTKLHVVGDPNYNYLWTPPTGVANPALPLTMARPTVTTTYTVTASYPGCPTNERSFDIFIEPNPLVDIAIEDTALCLIEPLTLHTTVDPPNSPYNYSWTPVDGNLSNPNDLEPDFWYAPNNAGVFNYLLTVTTPHGCVGTDSVRIETYPGIVSDIRISDTSICSNDSLLIEVDVTPSSMEATSTYVWSPSTYLSGDQILEPTYFTTVNAYNTYIYTLISTNEFGCHDTDQITIHSLVLPEVNIMPDTALCLEDPVQIKMQVGPEGDQFSYAWTPVDDLDDPSAKEPFFWNDFNTDHADYTLHVVVTEVTGGCRNYDTIHIHTYPHVFLNTIGDTLIKYGDRIQLWAENQLSHPLSYTWTPSTYLDNPNVQKPTANVLEQIVYNVYGMNEWGCRDTGTVNVNVDFTMDEFLPTAFSPNGDGRNDIFRLTNLRYQRVVEFRVFNRWGQEVYNGNGASAGWDGTFKGEPQDPGVYQYLIRVNMPDGPQKIYKGDITLVR